MKANVIINLLLSCISAIVLGQSISAQRSYPPEIEDSQVEVYKQADDIELRLWIFNPPGHSAKNAAPAIIFYFGGGWRSGSPVQFVDQAKWLAGRGMVAVLADYRVLSRHDVPARICVADAKSAMRYLRKHARRLGVDPQRIVAAGGSAGGHLAAAVATLPGFDDPRDDLAITAQPNALALFNPAVVLAPVDGLPAIGEDKLEELRQRMGTEPENMSPYHHLREKIVPTIIFHGIDDTTVPYYTVEAFYRQMKTLGNRCELVGYKGAGHGFFNSGRNDNTYFLDTMNKLDAFLVSLGYLKELPDVEYLR